MHKNQFIIIVIHPVYSKMYIILSASVFYVGRETSNYQFHTHRSQSTAMMLITSSEGSPTVSSTITIVTRPACGMPAAPILAAVAVTLKNNYNF